MIKKLLGIALELIRFSGERESKQRVGIRSAAPLGWVFDN